MLKTIFFVKTSVIVWLPVCSRTEQEALAIAEESVTEVFEIGEGHGGLQKEARVLAEYVTTEQPPEVDDEATVWGEAVPEDQDSVGSLRAHLIAERA